ncbi:VOC family protein [uncultured Friedmanniella sp.]|uniref:VOC family protein n=1 Tax=uncultured Friedmanniella sp. TaxID=335381 RepID=UPI0035C996E5
MITWAHVILDLPEAARSADEPFWSSVFGGSLADPWDGHPELASFLPPAGDRSVHRQLVGDGPPRVHLDLEVDDLQAETERLRLLGATPGRRVGEEWVTLSSPGGAVFCLVIGPASQDRPPPVVGAGGVRRRLVQVCLDIPPGRSHEEAAFWRSVVPWRWEEVQDPEFLGRLVPPPGAPLQLLLQELGPDDGGATVRAHLDVGSDDREATATELVGLGALRLGEGDGWVLLQDPAGMAFCVTAHPPDRP